jgi:hypothetical protein
MHGNNTRNIFLYSSLYLKLAKMPCLSYYVFSSTKSEKRRENRFCGGRGRGLAMVGERFGNGWREEEEVGKEVEG